MTADAAVPFTATVRESVAGPVVEVAGELDYESAPRLRGVLRRVLAVRPTPTVLVIDLGAVTFCDSAGLNALLQTRLDAERQETAVHLARPTDIVTRVLEITGAAQLFPVDPDIPAGPHTGAG
ncbi:anti-sigma factor antagonist [Kitasatospora indigofera]|uniref:Anti-sigma factor antagonist n=1 Tax=Kitasatospora indigofera TaxID=67307 RepID=A0A919GAS2_9ACTN|nr:STAS domain-containing protein [Kitasatospora indigofera]GHH80519.1 anti-sigma factor antagonist [Kitasatospora indigofera]